MFAPLKKNVVGMYVCGITPYDMMHIGHARTYIAFDVIYRYLLYKGYRVRYIQNITDIDDKIIKRAKELDIEPFELSNMFAKYAIDDQKKLGIKRPAAYPRVSENIDEIIGFIEGLIEKGYAYRVNGDVYFNIGKFKEYGKLSRQEKSEIQRHRIEPNPRKINPEDFALWKSVKEGEISFESPWGKGMPGWHIECSAISRKYLGEQFDIHGGAIDLIFPHHENEIAQTEALTGKRPSVKYWIHTGFLNVNGDKMSKSLGNIITVRELLQRCDAITFRFFVISNHYSSPINFSYNKLEQSKKGLNRIRNFENYLEFLIDSNRKDGIDNDHLFQKEIDLFRRKFLDSMDDDFNTPEALSCIFEFIRNMNDMVRKNTPGRDVLENALRTFRELESILGIEFKHGREFNEMIGEMIEERNKYRKKGEFERADKIRKRLSEMGIKLIDHPEGTRWEFND